jgi:hypothetical protein
MTTRDAYIELSAVFGVIVLGSYCIGGYEIDTPASGYKHPPNVNLATAGDTNSMGETVIVEVWGDDPLQMLDQAATSSPHQSFNWSHNFTKPTGGWPPGAAGCYLWTSPKGMTYEILNGFSFQNP